MRPAKVEEMSFPKVVGNCYHVRDIPQLSFLSKMVDLNFAVGFGGLKYSKLCTLLKHASASTVTQEVKEVKTLLTDVNIDSRSEKWSEVRKMLQSTSDGKVQVELSKGLKSFANKMAEKLWCKYAKFQEPSATTTSAKQELKVEFSRMILMEEKEGDCITTPDRPDGQGVIMFIEVGLSTKGKGVKPAGGKLLIRQSNYDQSFASPTAGDADTLSEHVRIPSPSDAPSSLGLNPLRAVLFARSVDHQFSKLTKGRRLIFTFNVAPVTTPIMASEETKDVTIPVGATKATSAPTMVEDKKKLLTKFAAEAKAKGFTRLAILCVHDYPTADGPVTTDELRGYDSELFGLLTGDHVPILLPVLFDSAGNKCYHSDLEDLFVQTPGFYNTYDPVDDDDEEKEKEEDDSDTDRSYKRKTYGRLSESKCECPKRIKTTATEEIERELGWMIDSKPYNIPSKLNMMPNLTSKIDIPALKDDPNYRLGKTLFLELNHSSMKPMYCDRYIVDSVCEALALVVPI
jgi:hypothetical protein